MVLLLWYAKTSAKISRSEAIGSAGNVGNLKKHGHRTDGDTRYSSFVTSYLFARDHNLLWP